MAAPVKYRTEKGAALLVARLKRAYPRLSFAVVQHPYEFCFTVARMADGGFGGRIAYVSRVRGPLPGERGRPPLGPDENSLPTTSLRLTS